MLCTLSTFLVIVDVVHVHAERIHHINDTIVSIYRRYMNIHDIYLVNPDLSRYMNIHNIYLVSGPI